MIEEHLYEFITGQRFNTLFKNYNGWKILGSNMTNYDFKFNKGLNINPFYFKNETVYGGLCFTSLNNLHKYQSIGIILAKVNIPNDATVYIEIDYCKTNQLDITTVYSFEEFFMIVNKNIVSNFIKENGMLLEYVSNITNKLKFLALKQNGYSIQFIKNPTEKMKRMAIKQCPYSIFHILNPTRKLIIIALKHKGLLIEYFNSTDEILQLIAVKQFGHSIKYIKNPSEKIKNEAIKQNKYSYIFINN